MSYVSKGMMSSADETWATPQEVFDALNAEFGFTLDVAASPANAKCPRYFTEADDALLQDWGREICWCNPPYGAKLAPFIRKARQASERGATVVMLIPARTDTRHWHDEVMAHATRIDLLKGRLRFGSAKGRAPFPSAIVVFGGRPAADRWRSVAVSTLKPTALIGATK